MRRNIHFMLLLLLIIVLTGGFSFAPSAKTMYHSADSQSISLSKGWNLISFRVDPSDRSVGAVFQPIAGKYDRVKGIENGQEVFYDPASSGTSTLQTIDPLHGYYVHMLEAADLEVTGEIIAYDTPIPLIQGDNLVAYLPEQAMAVDYALSSVFETVAYVEAIDHNGLTHGQGGDGGLAFDPVNYDFSTLQTMQPGFGYRIRMKAAGTLIYPLGESEATAIIGPQGGTLQLEDFQLKVPAGAFASDAELRVEVVSGFGTFSNEAVSRKFKITGLPDVFSKSLTVRIQYFGQLTHESFLVEEVPGFATSLNSEVPAFHFHEVIDSSGYLVGKLPPEQEQSLYKRLGMQDYLAKILQLVSQYQTELSKFESYKIHYPNVVGSDELSDLGWYLERARSTFTDLGFSWWRRKAWPIDVIIAKYKEGVIGFCSYGGNTDDRIWLMFNTEYFWRKSQRRVTSIHEVFHILHFLYDPRDADNKRKSSSDYIWLKEACARWSQVLYKESANLEHAYAARWWASRPFKGAQAGFGDNPADYGYGMAPLMEYLIKNYNTSSTNKHLLVRIWEKIQASEFLPWQAIQFCIGKDSFSWWHDFLKDYVTGDIYDYYPKSEDFTSWWLTPAVKDSMVIESAADTLKTFSCHYHDLSGRLFPIKLNFPNIDSAAVLQFTLSHPSDARVSVYKWDTKNRKSHLTCLAGPDSSIVNVDHIRAFTDSSYHLMAMVSHDRFQPPHDDSMKVDLKVRIVKNPIDLSLFRYVTITHNDIFGHYDNEAESEEIHWDIYEIPGQFTDKTFTGKKSSSEWGETGEVNVTVTVDSATGKVTRFSVSDDYENRFEGQLQDMHHFKIEGQDIPFHRFSSKYGILTYVIEGKNLCNHVTSVQHREGWQYDDEWQQTELTDYFCGDRFWLKIEFFKTIEEDDESQ